MAKRQIQPVRPPDPAELREWARIHGFPDLPDRGRIPSEVELKYLDYRYRARKRLITESKTR